MRLKPIVTQCLLAGVLSLPVSVGAVGLGRLTVHSALGQPLSAEIDLPSLGRDELATLTARIADPTAYRQNSLEYTASAARIRVQVANRPNGAPYLRLTSGQPIGDPFVDLLIELNWASGRLLRNYTFLLDPPGAVTTQAIEPALPLQAAATPRSGAAEKPASAAPASPGTAASGGSPAPAAAGAGAAATPSGAPPATARAAPRAAAATSAGSSGTVTVRRGDTLHSIAGRTRPAGASLEQMLLALFRANPAAFEGNNVNRLLAGSTLTLPTPEQVMSTPAAQAAQEIRVHASDWAAYRDRVASSAPTRAAGEARQGATGTITTAVEDKAGAVAPGSDRLTVSRSGEAAAGARGAAGARPEDGVARDKAISDVNSRVAELEKTVSDLRRALELKSQALSDLQRQAQATKGGEAPARTAAAPAAPSAPPAAPAPVAAAPAAPAAAPAAAAPSAAPADAKGQPQAAPADAKAATVVETPKAPAPVGDRATPKPVPPPEPGFFESLLGGTPMWAAGLAAIAVLGGGLALLAARRRRDAEKVEETIAATDMKAGTVFGSTASGAAKTMEPSISSEFSRDGLGNIDTDEVDPIAEAEVYLAYGRDSQAEEILKDALKKDATRQEVYLKLLEIHAQHNKPSAFESVAAQLHVVSGGTGEVWERAAALGRQIDPTNRLYGGGAPLAAAAAGGAPPVLDLVSPRQRAEPHGLVDERTRQLPNDLDFNLDEFIPSLKGAQAGSEVPEYELGIDAPPAPRSEPAAPQRAPLPVAAGAKPTSPAEREAYDFDLRLDDVLGEARGEAAGREPAYASVDFGAEPAGLAGGAPSFAGGPPPVPANRPDLEFEGLDLNFGGTPAKFDEQSPQLDGQWQDAATKLDLAKAYQEMGDVEGAREILQEVLKEGNDQQKKDAQALLSRMAS